MHPVKKQTMRRNEITEYAADMNLLLAYYHLEDDWADEKNRRPSPEREYSGKRQTGSFENIHARAG